MSRTTTPKDTAKPKHRHGRHTNPIIYGYFPHKTYNELAISRVNRTLCILLGIMILISLVSYYFVTSSEMTLNLVGKETTALNNENVELQNKLDNMHSFNNVDIAVRKHNLLNTAKQVIEVPEAIASVETAKPFHINRTQNPNKWSVGF